MAGNTATASNDYEIKNTSCTGAFTQGRDVVFSYTARVSGIHRFVVTPTNWDAALYALDSCPSVGTGLNSCTLGADTAPAGGAEMLTLPLNAGQATFLVVDAFGIQSAGSFQIEAQEPAPGDSCGTALALDLRQPGDSVTVRNDTRLFSNDYSGNGCGGFYGPDLAYSFNPSVRSRFIATVTPDVLSNGEGLIPVLDLDRGCSSSSPDQVTCQSASTVQPQSLRQKLDPRDGGYTLWVDGLVGSGAVEGTRGPFTLEARLEPIVPPANDSCLAPAELTLGAAPLRADLTEANDDHRVLPDSGCGGDDAGNAGPDLVWFFRVPDAGRYAFHASPVSGGRLTAALTTACPSPGTPLASCVAASRGESGSFSGGAAQVRYEATGAQTLFAVVDSSSLDTPGEFDVSAGAAPSNDVCAGVEEIGLVQLADGGLFGSADVDLRFAFEDTRYVQQPSGFCSSSTVNGPDVAFHVVLPTQVPGLTVRMSTADADDVLQTAVFIRQGNCVDSSDGGVQLACDRTLPITTRVSQAIGPGTFTVWVKATSDDAAGRGRATVTVP